MKIVINIDEIEFEEETESEGSKKGVIQSSFHDKVRIKKSFEAELARLFLATEIGESNSTLLDNTAINNDSALKNFEKMNFIQEVDGGEIDLSPGVRNSSQVGKVLANSIYNSLNLTRTT